MASQVAPRIKPSYDLPACHVACGIQLKSIDKK
jgi:hypothetical protein